MNTENKTTENKTFVVIENCDSYYKDISHRDGYTTFCYHPNHYAWVLKTGTLEECQRILFDIASNSSDDVSYIDEATAVDIKIDSPEFEFKGDMLYKYGEPFFKFGDMNFEDDLRYYRVEEIREAFEYYDNNYLAGKDFAKVLQYLNVDTSEFYAEGEEQC